MTFELGLQHRRGLRREENLLSMFGERTRLVAWQNQLPQQSRSVANVVILVVFGQIKDVLAEKFGLFRVCDTQLSHEVDDLQLNDVIL